MLAQREVDAKSNEITAFRPLLDPLELTGAVVTFDALLTQTDHAKFLVEEKQRTTSPCSSNHPSLHTQVKTHVIIPHRTRERRSPAVEGAVQQKPRPETPRRKTDRRMGGGVAGR